MKKTKLYFFLAMGFAMVLPGMVLADTFGLQATAEASGLSGYGTNIPVMIGNILGSVLGLVAVIFFALMLYGGVLWMTARGDDGQTKKATGTITAAIVGIMIILASYAITSFVFTSIGQPGAVTGTGLGTATDSGGNATTAGPTTENTKCDNGAGYCKATCEATETSKTDASCKLVGAEYVCCVPKVPVTGSTGTTGASTDCTGAGMVCAASAQRWQEEVTGQTCKESGEKCYKTREVCKQGGLGLQPNACCDENSDCCASIMPAGWECKTESTTYKCTNKRSNLCGKNSSGVCAETSSCKPVTASGAKCVGDGDAFGFLGAVAGAMCGGKGGDCGLTTYCTVKNGVCAPETQAEYCVQFNRGSCPEFCKNP